MLKCQEIKCPHLDNEGEPKWCFEKGCPAVVALNNCLKAKRNGDGDSDGKKKEEARDE